MGFTPDQVGLTGERVSAVFREMRSDGCPHKGIDITSSGAPKPFSAGVFGRVVSPLGGPWGTITVSPFNRPSTLIQYLHCSSINVGVGEVVAPWSNLGLTGDTAPAGSGITGIHLHVQVVEPGMGSEACWGNRNFVDPLSWPTLDLLAGDWRWGWEKVLLGSVKKTATRTLQLLGSYQGAGAMIDGDDVYENTYNGITWTCTGGWFNGQVSRSSRTMIMLQFISGTCTCTDGRGCDAINTPVEILMVDMNRISMSAGGAPFIATRAGSARPVRQSFTSTPRPVGELPGCSVAMSAEIDDFSGQKRDPRMSPEEWYGVLKGEVF